MMHVDKEKFFTTDLHCKESLAIKKTKTKQNYNLSEEIKAEFKDIG